MAKFFCAIFLVCFCALSHGVSPLRETLKCRSLCERTYPLHTYPTIKHLQACKHGCYKSVFNKAWSYLGFGLVHNCSQECMDHFASGSYYACKLGCVKGLKMDQQSDAGLTVPRKSTPPHDEQHSTVAPMILRPVVLLHTYGVGIINKLTYYIQSSTSYYFTTKNGGMVVVNVQNQPQVYISSSHYYGQDPAIQNDESDVQGVQKHQTSSYREQHESWIVVRRGHHWLHCVSHKSGVPMWILSSILFLSSFFLLWLCCAATVTSPSAKKSQKPAEKKAFLIKEFLSASEKKDDQDVPLLSLDDTEKQAEPLPRKDKPAVISI